MTSFRGKLIAASIVCILIPTLVTLVVYNYLTRDAVKDQAVSNAQQTLQLVDGHVTNTLKHMLYLMNYFQVEQSGIGQTFKQFISGDWGTANPAYEEYKARADIMTKIESVTAAGEPSYLTILLSNGTYFMNYRKDDDFDPVLLITKPWITKVQGFQGLDSYWVGVTPTEFRRDKATSPYQLTAVRQLDSRSRTGVIVVTIMERQIGNYFREVSAVQGQEVMLLDGNDQIISHADINQIGTSFPYLKQLNKQEDNIVQIDGKNYLISKRVLAVNGWKLVSLIPYSTAVSKINSIFENVFTFQLISFILFFILLMVAIRAFTKPLLKLDKVATSVQKGELHLRSSIRGQDEIGRLGKSFDQMLDRISDMIIEVTRTQARKRKAELDMLQAQINPHFLFNVLNSIRMKVLGKGDRESAEMIASLSKLLRMTIQDQGNIPLHDEVDTVIDYMKLMNMRQKDKVDLEIDIDNDVFLEQVPRFFLQPIIENALIHGLNQQAGTIQLNAHAEADHIRICIRDSGQGMDQATLERLRSKLAMHTDEMLLAEPEKKKGFSSIGLQNVNERMRMTFGDAFLMQVDSEIGAGTAVTLIIPKQMQEQEEVHEDV
ncbi:sensor histidine kinase [Paenibacillus sp. WST5]|uniref:Sensor histidine kinase n=2 Tax=Paenibacillus sedimenti TaxID=2770274 RepID=A0A926KQF7_9BACL|nr:sensor histidine kinase [Paenibacillus sedimenti]